ncbi:MAG: DUF1851 domain-containing protein [Sulfurovum sp.]|nr:MAG: DUF1851 domain-containing protein [Sulfurovum sp.]
MIKTFINKLLDISSKSIHDVKYMVTVSNSVECNKLINELKITSTIIDFYNIDDKILFFAQDIFGNQFCIFNSNIYLFDIETGDTELIASDFEELAKKILDNYDYLTGYSLAYEWQTKYGKLAENERLMPKIPFVLGGEYKIENLTKVNIIEYLNFRSDFAKQIKNISDGEQIKFEIQQS